VHKRGSGEPTVNLQIDRYHTDTRAAGLSRSELRDRMVLLMISEAARCLEEKIVAEPADVDFAMIMGTGFAPFLGGPLRFADFTNIQALVGQMEKLASRGETRFAPCELLKSMASKNETFYKR
jgi:3-hydroxyacyl-CoA dehydrogenase/enoyl-CoA hydratase/3-hydroxybutyryl-CoA epimerase